MDGLNAEEKKKGKVALEPCHPQKKERDSFFLTFALKFVRADVQKKNSICGQWEKADDTFNGVYESICMYR